ncbi:conserved hypothetical protein [Desulfosarcina cetonica]|uniref:hypothetical protein n=1 Tax=Desulfosarcina cetonica TaxID=90730 RepID=UPI00155DBA1F|nr:hypothetical protein [Desulfosarcina cetonica]VTR71531.1 conserved hypothetical protein [Desulfosarcina cetonica]
MEENEGEDNLTLSDRQEEYKIRLPLAQYLGLDVKTVRKYHQRLGGIRLGRRFVFFEKELINAVSERKEMDRPSAKDSRGWPGIQEKQGVLDQEGSQGLGSQDGTKTSRRVGLDDRHGLFE